MRIHFLERIAEIGVCDEDVQACPVHVLECRNGIAARFAQGRQQSWRSLHVRHRHQRRSAVGGERKQLQHRGGDHAETAFGAEEKLLQIVTRIVFA